MRRGARRLTVEISYAARRPWAPSPRELRAWAAAALPRSRRLFVLSIHIVGAARSRSLNARYRNKRRPTNVLSFAGAGAAPDGRHFIGELIICAPLAAREALQQGKTARAHWAHLTVHGVLHLLGHDHARTVEAREMAGREVQILDRLGFSDPYR